MSSIFFKKKACILITGIISSGSCCIPTCTITTSILITVHIISFCTYRESSPTVIMSISSINPAIRSHHRGQYSSSSNKHIISVITSCLIILIVYFKNRFSTPFSRFPENACIIINQIIFTTVNNVCHILQSCSITRIIILIHHYFRIKHVSHCQSNTTIIFRFFSHW